MNDSCVGSTGLSYVYKAAKKVSKSDDFYFIFLKIDSNYNCDLNNLKEFYD